MSHRGKLGLGLALLLWAPHLARAQSLPPGTAAPAPAPTATQSAQPVPGNLVEIRPGVYMTVQDAAKSGTPIPQGNGGTPAGNGGAPSAAGEQPETRPEERAREEGQPTAEPKLGPAPLQDAKLLQNWLFGADNKKPCFNISGWADFDFTYRSTGHGENNIAPVMNRFGDEALVRELGILISKPLDPKEWSWGYNAILIAGSDAAFIGPTAGWFAQNDPRFGLSFTDLNLTAHMPILTEGGVDIKAGRQTTVLGPMGALAWQRYFDSSDYAWYNLEEGRYTGVSADWHISKQLDWYNGIEIGGWGVFFDAPTHSVNYLTQINYWLDEKAQDTKVWTTVLTGPTGFTAGGSSTVLELGLLKNWSKYVWQILDTQMVWSHAPVFGTPPPGYLERAYDIYNYMGIHLCKTLDFNTRFEWYDDVDGGGYPGGFGIPHTDYWEGTVGFNYHPNKYVEFRPEFRYDHASNPAFGAQQDRKNQISIAADLLFKF